MQTSRILDVGCASGVFLDTMRDKGWEVEGIDVSAFAVDIAKSKGHKVHKGDFLESGYPNSFFNLVTMWDVIEHINNPLSFFQECHRILKPGGCLIATTPDAGAMLAKMPGKMWMGFRSVGEHVYFFNRRTMESYPLKAGFHDLRFHSVGKYLTFERIVTRLCHYTRLFRVFSFLRLILSAKKGIYINSGDTMAVVAIKS